MKNMNSLAYEKLITYDEHDNFITWKYNQEKEPLKFEKDETFRIANIVRGEIEFALNRGND